MTAYTRLLRGDPADEIVAYADTVDADLIVVGSRGHGAVTSVAAGQRLARDPARGPAPGAGRSRRGRPP